MKSYLSLVPISAKVRKRQNRMTVLCIIISVLLVTTIFSVVDMVMRGESAGLRQKHGNWHIRIEQIAQDTAREVGRRPDVAAIGWSEVFNQDTDQPYYIEGKKAALYGADGVYLSQLVNVQKEGAFPQSDHEVMLSENAKIAFDVQVGSQVTIQTPAGDASYTVSGFGSDDAEYYQGQAYLVAVYMTRPAFSSLMAQNGVAEHPVCYVQFQNASKASQAMEEIKRQYRLPEETISENTAVMGLAGQSSNQSMKNIYGIAAVLFLLVLLAGTLMISGSMNSNIAQRTKFFGMLRCIGASRRQMIRYVRLEALNWCKTAVPAGLALGIVISCCVCALLHYGIGGEFAATPVFALSLVGVSSGTLVGVVTVLLAAQAPAKRAARVSPMAAVSGNSDTAPSKRRISNPRFWKTKIRTENSSGGMNERRAGRKTGRKTGRKIEWVLGIHHATASKKNWFLMTASFSLSIILLLCFSVGLDFVRGLIPTMRSWQPDIVFNGYANELCLTQEFCDAVRAVSGVEHVFQSAYMERVPATSSRQGIDHVNLISYSGYLLDSSSECLMQGNLSQIYGDSGKAMTVLNKDNPLKVGDSIQIAGKEVEIACAVSDGLYPSEYSVICSQETFSRLTGERNYSMLGLQLCKGVTDKTIDGTINNDTYKATNKTTNKTTNRTINKTINETILQLSALAGPNVIFSDVRKSNEEDKNTYLAARFVMYSFLALIAMITMFHMINSISMSATARMKQYGVMRAVGMDARQLTRMIAAEAFTYAISGLVVGCGAGVVISRFLYIRLVTRYFGMSWRLPAALLSIILVFVVACAAAAVYAPAKRMRSMAVTDTINDL